MNIALLGPQGSGKGTQAEMLVRDMGMTKFETGKFFRESKDPEIRSLIDQGKLVPDETTNKIILDFINENDNGNLLFDGSPRTISQYEVMKKHLQLVIFLKISEKETVRRLSARRQCAVCGQIYNLITAPARCDHNQPVQREDDKPEAIKKRLELFRAQTEPVIEMARQDGLLLEIDGERPIEVIAKDIKERL
ncbi:MAG: nucleoside monophosphate kinase [Patescibacteria group bacterium]